MKNKDWMLITFEPELHKESWTHTSSMNDGRGIDAWIGEFRQGSEPIKGIKL